MMRIKRPVIQADLEEKELKDLYQPHDYILELDGYDLNEPDFTTVQVEKVRLYNCVIRDGIFKDMDLSDADLTDVRFIGCDFSNVNLSQASIYKC